MESVLKSDHKPDALIIDKPDKFPMIGNCSKIKIFCWLLIIGGFFIWPNFSSGAANEVVINEIAWMGTSESADEWIELYNNDEQDINLEGWGLYEQGGETLIEPLTGVIGGKSYYLIERGNDDTVPDVEASQPPTSWGGYGLNNNGEHLQLLDTNSNVIDEVNCEGGWFTGNNTTKQTMERINPQDSGNNSVNWQNSQNAGGTPKAPNSRGEKIPSEEEPTEEPEVGGWIPPTVVNQPPVAEAGSDITALVNQEIIFDAWQSFDPDNDSLAYFWNFGDGASETEEKASHTYLYAGQYIVSLLVDDGELSDLDIITVNIYSSSVIISEFIPNPKGEDQENEWIELFNQSDQMANLTNWQLDDQAEDSSPFVFPANSLIGPHQFLVIRRPITKISLNNDQDQVRLLYPDGSLATEVSYFGENEEGSAVAFDGLDYFWTKIPTPGSANIISSIGLEENQNISSNNPLPIIQETQEPPEILAKINLNQGQEFSALAPSESLNKGLIQEQTLQPTDSTKPEQIAKQTIQPSSQQDASLIQSSQSSQKANLILTLSIIISGSLLASWLLIRLRKKFS